MHIAVEGMDGVGKTSIAKETARRLGFTYYSKSLHDMNDVSGRYDDFVTVMEMSREPVDTHFGFRGSFLVDRLMDRDIVSDRFLVSNFWAHTHGKHLNELDMITALLGVPDLTILLYADKEVITRRMIGRNPNDKDIPKLKLVDEAYRTMLDFVNITGIPCVMLDTTELDFEQVADQVERIVRTFLEHGIEAVENEYCRIKRSENVSEICCGGAVFRIVARGEEKHLLSVRSDEEEITVPDGIAVVEGFSFSGCHALRRAVISPSVKRIAPLAFHGCGELREFSAEGSSVYSVENGLLVDRESETVVLCPKKKTGAAVIPAHIRNIGNYAFEHCAQVEEVVASAVERIGFGAFVGAEKINKLHLGSPETICRAALLGCVSLSEIKTEGGRYIFDGICLKDTAADDIIWVKPQGKETVVTSDGKLSAWALAFCRSRLVRVKGKCRRIAPYCFFGAETMLAEFLQSPEVIADSAFYKAECLESVILGGEAMPETERSAFVGGSVKRLYCNVGSVNNRDFFAENGIALLSADTANTETERKYLFTSIPADGWTKIRSSSVQRMFLSLDPEIRLSSRVSGDICHYNLTIKSTDKFIRREIRLVLTEEQFVNISALVPTQPLQFDVDTYENGSELRISFKHCRTNGVSFAEIEFESESDYIGHIDEIEKMEFLSKDVTFDEEYYLRNMWKKRLETSETERRTQ